MNYFLTQLKLTKQINAIEFIKLLNNMHQIQLNHEDFQPGIHHVDDMTLFAFDNLDILGISLMKHQHIYEYVYQVSTHDIYITIKMKTTSSLKSPDCIIYLIENDYLQSQSFFYYDKPLRLRNDNLNIFYQELQNMSLPIIYLSQNIHMRFPKLHEELAMSAQGFAFVVYSDDKNIDKQLYSHLHLSPASYIFYSSHDYKMMTPTKHDKSVTFKQNIIKRLLDYMTKKDYLLSLDKLKMRYLNEELDEMKEEEKNILNHLEHQSDNLDFKLQELFAHNENIDQTLTLVQLENEHLSHMLQQQNHYPILIQGDIEEYYEGEQKDIILDILKQELRNNPSNQILKDIIEHNPEIGVRKKYLEEIYKILKSDNKITSRMIEKLRDYGICIYKSEHYYCHFFEHEHYLITLSSTPSDKNAVRQMYRSFRKYYF